MSKRPRRNHAPAFKAKVALDALKGDQTIVELSQRYQVHPNQITDWKKQLLEHAADIFGKDKKTDPSSIIKELHAKIGQLSMENDFLFRGARSNRRHERKTMIDRKDPLPITRQCSLLDLSRSGFYYAPSPLSAKDLELMRQIDEIHLAFPFYGSRKIRDELWARKHNVGRDRVRRLMRRMGIEALYVKPRLSLPHPEHVKYPYLLRGLEIKRANQVWATDITYIPMAKGFCYLVAIMDWASRMVLSWRLSNTLDSAFCVDALEEAIAKYGCPEIFNTDQGSQFTAETFTYALKSRGITISMDGKGRWMDNVFIERLWRSVKYEDIYLKAYNSMAETKRGLAAYFTFYNEKRWHQNFDRKTPAMVYFDSLPQKQAAA
ncbi:IS3 family transposase [Syntrophus buswellii]|uniref:IS3 family transposase n=1 Tax=Syntrophus buswellii TaxID=43774 RepID=UPI0038D46AC7